MGRQPGLRAKAAAGPGAAIATCCGPSITAGPGSVPSPGAVALWCSNFSPDP
jgi:hypothetical protein